MPAADSIEHGALPLGLAADIKMRRNVAAGSILRWVDVDFDDNDTAVQARREMEVAFSTCLKNIFAGDIYLTCADYHCKPVVLRRYNALVSYFRCFYDQPD